MKRDSKLLIPQDIEWRKWVTEIMEKGGSLWVVERTDTNQCLIKELDLNLISPHDTFSILPNWKETLPNLNNGVLHCSAASFYPTKELAKKFAPKEIREGGCRCCGNGSKKVPIKLTEHEFVNSKEYEKGT